MIYISQAASFRIMTSHRSADLCVPLFSICTYKKGAKKGQKATVINQRASRDDAHESTGFRAGNMLVIRAPVIPLVPAGPSGVAVRSLTRIPETFCSTLGRDTGFPQRSVSWFTSALPGKCWDISFGPRHISSKFLQFHHYHHHNHPQAVVR